MCGIVGVVGHDDAASLIVDALRRLEYRGYDSAGVATLVDGAIDRRRAEGKLFNLELSLHNKPLTGRIGIGHTRWATHGAPTERNAHPHATEAVAVVHNGIIENFRNLRDRLTAEGARFETETDTEVIVHLATRYLEAGLAPREAAAATLKELEGAFALGMIFRGEQDLLIGARRGSPLAVGVGQGAMYLGSDAFALAPMTNKVAYLEDGDWVEMTAASYVVRDGHGHVVDRPAKIVDAGALLVDKGDHRHYMAKEIFEQPEVLAHTLGEYLDPLRECVVLPDLGTDLAKVERLVMIGCGTAHYATMAARAWFEKLAGVPVDIDVASEFRYREPFLPANGLGVFVSQSGETADTLAALDYCAKGGLPTLGIVNVVESSIGRKATARLPILAGPEIGVASTKAFTCQLIVLCVLAIAIGRARGVLSPEREAECVRHLLEVPGHVAEALSLDREIKALGYDLAPAQDVIYIGRGQSFALALEAALKLKEISYIHAEGQAAGELKHGSIALIEENVPVIVLAPTDAVYDKVVSNMQEVAARKGKVVLVSDAVGLAKAGSVWRRLAIPSVDPLIQPIVLAVPVQLIAYHTAVQKGTDVDQPRNLAKAVTVE